MTTPVPTTTPVRTTAARIPGIDLARGLAVVGMIGAHVGLAASFDWADPATWTEVVHGRPSILFGVLAGVSLAVLTHTAGGTGGVRRAGSVDGLRRLRLQLVGRGAAVFAVGVVLELLWSPIAVILTTYGLLFVLVVPFLSWSTRRLAVAAAVLVVLGPPVRAAVTTLSMAEGGAPGGAGLVLTGLYPITTWGALLLVGLCIGRLPLDRTRVAAVLLGAGAALAVLGYTAAALLPAPTSGGASAAASLSSGTPVAPEDLVGLTCFSDDGVLLWCPPSTDQGPGGAEADADAVAPGSSADDLLAYDLPSYLEQLSTTADWSSVPRAWTAWHPHSGGTLELVASGGFAVGVLGLCLLVARPLRLLVAPVVAAGSLPLTVYSVHVVLFALGAGTLFSSELATWLTVSAALCAAALAWRLFIGRGPLERAVAAVGDAFAGPPAGADR
jgi:uncharacterized membrane protein